MIEATNIGGFAARDLQGLDRWESRDETTIPFATQVPVVTGATGTPKYKLRWRLVGKLCEGQMYFYNHTLLTWTVSTDYFLLPVTASGWVGQAHVTRITTNAGAGQGALDITNSRCYLPALAATADTMGVFFRYEVA